jgi:general secretion pathway protein D
MNCVNHRILRRAGAGFLAVAALLSLLAAEAQVSPKPAGGQPLRISMDFNEVELPAFVRFMSELTGKNFVLDDKVTEKMKVSVFSPTKVTVDQAYSMFLAALEVSRLTALPKGNIIQIVPVGEVPPEREVFVYKLKHANAADLSTMLVNLTAKSQTAVLSPGTRPPLKPINEFDAPVSIFADKPTNSLIISATRSGYQTLLTVIRELDTRRKQVFLEAVIMEVSVDRLRRLGMNPTEAGGALERSFFRAIIGLNKAPEEIASIAQSLSGATTGSAVTILDTVNVRAFLQLLLTQSDANILSTPQILASDNQKAKIVVGENRPFPTGQAQGITGGTLVTIERKDVGVTLEMTPQVLENDLVRLEVKQEITAIAENVAQTIGSGTATVPVGPTTTKRSMETIAIAHDQQTLVVGGLVRDNIVINVQKVPFFGDIPLLGWLFKTESKQTEKLSLLVFLTPHIIKDEVDMVEFNAKKATEVGRLQQENVITDPTGLKREVGERLGTPGAAPSTPDEKP